MVFNEKYIRDNKDIISYFLKGIISEKGLHSIVINDLELIEMTLDIILNIKDLTSLYITPNEKLNFDICDKLSNNKNLTYINCYDMPEFMFEKINQYSEVKIDLRCEIFSVSNFISLNKLNTFSSIYYKEQIQFDKLMTVDDKNDFETFCKINRNLKNIIINYYFIGDIKRIIETLKNNNIRNIKILILTDDKNFLNVEESIPYLKSLNKRLKKSNNIRIKIKYSNEYKNNKYVKQWNINNLRVCGYILIILSLIFIGYTQYYKYMANKSVDDVQKIAKKDNKKTNNTATPESNESTNEDEVKETKKRPPLKEDYDALKKINKDTVGWITVNNTSVNYPVVKANDNEYYLKRTFYKYVNSAGWIYMDYRNNIDELDDNTIIYGHNMRQGTLMFTTLQKTLKESWYSNPNNQIITFNTVNSQMKWQIFSIYAIDPTTDYLTTRFSTAVAFKSFADNLKSRSIYNFNVEIDGSDKILTLSTCTEKGTKRLVIHAKLIK